ncbi:UNVERIFIED_ORG: hypothetical protein ABRZ91_000851 [Heyndrickxia coagulans]
MKKFSLLLFTIILITAASGCSLFTKEVDYQKIADDLNKKNMDAILYAVDGYANYDQTSFIDITYKVNHKYREETNKLNISGIYNTNNSTAVGTGQKSFQVFDNPNNSKSTLVKDDTEPSFHLSYSNNQYINTDIKKPIDVQFIFDKLQGIEKLKPVHFTYGLDESPSINYKLNEKEFNEIVNDNFKIKYDNFKSASIFISLNEDNNKLYIDYIRVGVSWEGQFNHKQADFTLLNMIYPNQDNKNAHAEFKKYINMSERKTRGDS